MSVSVDGGVLDTDSAKMLVSYIERIERMEEEKSSIAEDIKNEFVGAKGHGFDTKTMKTILKLRKMNADDIQETDALLEAYRAAVGLL